MHIQCNYANLFFFFTRKIFCANVNYRRQVHVSCIMNCMLTHYWTDTHTGILIIKGTLHRCNGFSTLRIVFLSPYTNPKPTPHTKHNAFLYSQKCHSVCIMSCFPNGDLNSVPQCQSLLVSLYLWGHLGTY